MNAWQTLMELAAVWTESWSSDDDDDVKVGWRNDTFNQIFRDRTETL